MLVLLEFDVHDRRSDVSNLHRWFVRLVQEVPNVNSVSFGDVNDTRSSWAETAAGVLGILGVRRSEDRFVVTLKGSLPDGKVEIMDCH